MVHPRGPHAGKTDTVVANIPDLLFLVFDFLAFSFSRNSLPIGALWGFGKDQNPLFWGVFFLAVSFSEKARKEDQGSLPNSPIRLEGVVREGVVAEKCV